MFVPVLGACLSGALAAILWAAVAHSANFEIGYLAVGVGALVGWSYQRFARGVILPGSSPIVAAIAILTVVGGRLGALELQFREELQAELAKALAADGEDAIGILASRELEARMASGVDVSLPAEFTLERTATVSDDFPADVWSAASDHWAKMPPAERDQMREENASRWLVTISQQHPAALMGGLVGSASIIDLLFLALAVSAAVRCLGARRAGPSTEVGEDALEPLGRA